MQNTKEDLWSTNFSINGSMPIFTGLQNKNIIIQNQLTYESSKYDIESVKSDVTISIVNAYLQVLFTNELLKNAQNQIELSIALLNKMKQYSGVGYKNEIDLLQLKADLAIKKVSLVNAKGQLETKKIDLQELMNINIQNFFDIEYTEFIEPEIYNLLEPEILLISALKNHPSIISSHLKTQSVIYSIKASRGSMLPQLSLTGNLYTNYSNASQLNQVSYINTSQNIGYLQSNHNEIVVRDAIQPIDNYSKYSFKNQLKDNISNSVSLSLFVPIFNNENRHTIEKLKISLENSKLNEQVVKNNFRNNFEQINRDVENAIAKYNTTKEQLEVLQMLFKNTNLKYNAGLISITDLLIEKNKYAQAESDNIQARFELILRIKILEYLQLEKQ